MNDRRSSQHISPKAPRWERLEQLFDQALDLPTADRDAFLATACSDDPRLRDEVADMLAAHDRVDGILEQSLRAPFKFDLEKRLRDALGDRYTVERELGRGGMAAVYLATERKHARRVVLKVLKPEAAAACGTDRFLREVRIAAELAHPHILGLIDSGEADGLLFYVMPFVEGETLRQRLGQGSLPYADAVVLLSDIADALAYAHRHSVVHRDLKPENVFCVRGHAFLMDFGVAKRLQGPGLSGILTEAGVSVGTPAYMAPEQAAGRPDVDHRADLFAFGLLGYEMLTGRSPWSDDAAADASWWSVPIRSIRPDAPRDLVELVESCLEPDPDRRLPNADEVVHRLRRFATPADGVSAPSAPRRRRTGSLVAIVLAVGVGAVVAIRMVTSGPAAVDGVAAPVAVTVFANETGNPEMDAWGRMAGDWITQGLQESGVLPAVPWTTMLGADARLTEERAAGRPTNPIAIVREETGAGTIITGAYYAVGGELRFQVEITDARTNRLLGAPPSVAAPIGEPETAIRLLRERIMGTMAVLADERLSEIPGLARRPPTFDAYRAFDDGMERHLNQDYGEAALAFRQAYALDTTWVVPLLYASLASWNRGEYATVDTLLRMVQAREQDMSEYHNLLARHIQGWLRSDADVALQAIRRAAQLAPSSRAPYHQAMTALDMNRPREALGALNVLDPDRGVMRGWSSYWTQLTYAHHLLGDHASELAAARGLRRRFPDRRVGWVLEARALAAAGNTAPLDSLLDAQQGLPGRTYWSAGAAMVAAGEELLAHFDEGRAEPYLQRALGWFERELQTDPDYSGHLYWYGSLLYDRREWASSYRVFSRLAGSNPERVDYRGLAAVAAARMGRSDVEAVLGPPPTTDLGDYTAIQARIAAIQGDADRAISLFSEALRQGMDGFPWLHSAAYHDVSLIRDHPGYRRLMTPSDQLDP
jgi:tetratricopeptide (TPR) repeat protein